MPGPGVVKAPLIDAIVAAPSRDLDTIGARLSRGGCTALAAARVDRQPNSRTFAV
jgi:hypothetical protein